MTWACVVLFVCYFLGWIALRRHHSVAAASPAIHPLRYSGLAFALLLWSGLTFAATKRQVSEREWSLEYAAWTFLLHGSLSMPIVLGSGLLYRAVMRRVFRQQ